MTPSLRPARRRAAALLTCLLAACAQPAASGAGNGSDDVGVAPPRASVGPNESVQFTAVAAGGVGQVVWSVVEAGGGTVTATGAYTAPATAGTYTVMARSAIDASRAGTATVTVSAQPGPGPTGSAWFALMSEMYGDAGATAQQRLAQNLLNGVTFHPVLTSSEQQFLQSTKAPFGYFAVPAEANIASCYPSANDANAGSLLTTLTQQLGPKVFRIGMPEFDQGGGCWAAGRPSMAGLSDATAYSTWTSFYLDTKGLRPYLSQSAAQRGYKWASVCSFAFCTQYAFDLGSDAVLLERNEDEMSGITPGLAMVRGAASQHGGREWGIDFSTWRYWTNGPTVYAGGKLTTGWSTATWKRNLFVAYMGGANMVHVEAADYTGGAASGAALNPLGQTVQAFADFALTRHPSRGTPYVPVAILQQHASGLEPKFGEWMQGDSKWYWTNAYTAGDHHFSNLLSVVYPGYASWGTLPAGSPKVLSGGSIDIAGTQNAYRSALAAGADPRPWEPMGTSRWGESFDLLTDQAPLSALQRYRAVVVATGTPLSSTLLAALTTYAQGGGVVVLNATQLTAAAESLTGLHLTGGRATASAETWLPDGSTVAERSYAYAVATPTTATVVAQAGGNPIVTHNAVGSGAVWVTTPDLLSDTTGTALLAVGQKVLDAVVTPLAKVVVNGPNLEYLVGTDGDRIIVTLVNTDIGGGTWNGTLSFPAPAGNFAVREWTGDTTVSASVQGGRVVANASVPPFDVRVYVLDPG
jgi:hypothetical protein